MTDWELATIFESFSVFVCAFLIFVLILLVLLFSLEDIHRKLYLLHTINTSFYLMIFLSVLSFCLTLFHIYRVANASRLCNILVV